MKKALLLPLLSLFLLAGCSNVDINTGKSNGKGIVDCYQIGIGNNTYSYTLSHYAVGKFSSANGKVIYYGSSYLYEGDYLAIYETRFDLKQVTYNLDELIGKVTIEKNIYLNLDEKIIDFETKVYPYQGPTEQIKFDPAVVYSAIKNNFYLSGETNYSLDTSFNGMERHSYIKCSDDVSITYTAKNFK